MRDPTVTWLFFSQFGAKKFNCRPPCTQFMYWPQAKNLTSASSQMQTRPFANSTSSLISWASLYDLFPSCRQSAVHSFSFSLLPQNLGYCKQISIKQYINIFRSLNFGFGKINMTAPTAAQAELIRYAPKSYGISWQWLTLLQLSISRRDSNQVAMRHM